MQHSQKNTACRRVNLSSIVPWNFLSYFFVWTFGEEMVWFENIFNRFITLCFVLKDRFINTSVSGIPCQGLRFNVRVITSLASSRPFLISELNCSPDFQCKWLWYQPLMIKVTAVQTSGASNDDDAFDLYVTFHFWGSPSTYNFWQTCAELMGYVTVYSAIIGKCSEERLTGGWEGSELQLS